MQEWGSVVSGRELVNPSGLEEAGGRGHRPRAMRNSIMRRQVYRKPRRRCWTGLMYLLLPGSWQWAQCESILAAPFRQIRGVQHSRIHLSMECDVVFFNCRSRGDAF